MVIRYIEWKYFVISWVTDNPSPYLSCFSSRNWLIKELFPTPTGPQTNILKEWELFNLDIEISW